MFSNKYEESRKQRHQIRDSQRKNDIQSVITIFFANQNKKYFLISLQIIKMFFFVPLFLIYSLMLSNVLATTKEILSCPSKILGYRILNLIFMNLCWFVNI